MKFLLLLASLIIGIVTVSHFPFSKSEPSNVYILEDNGSFDAPLEEFETSLDLEQIVTTFFKRYPKDYDFLAIFPSFPPNKEFDTVANSWEVLNDIRGICREIRKECYWGPCGSDRLKAVHVFTYRKNNYDELVKDPELIDETLLHEVGHHWGVSLGSVDPADKLPDGVNPSCTDMSIPLANKDDDHWSEGLQMPKDSGFGAVREVLPWVDRGNGIYSYNLSYFEEPIKYHPFDMYLMGLMDPSEIKQDFLLLTEREHYFGPLPDGSQIPKDEIVVKAKVTKVTIDDVIKIAGERRSLDSKKSQKDFREAFVIITKKGQKPSENMLKTIKEAAKIFPSLWGLATDNRSTMNK